MTPRQPTLQQLPRAALLVAIAALLVGLWMHGQSTSAQPAGETQPQRLAVLWTSGDPEVAHRVAFMYTQAAASQRWFDEVQLIVWGPSARLLAADKDVQALVANLKAAGADVKACVVCADSYGVTETLRSLGLEVKAMGRPLTELLQDDDWQVLTF